VPIESTIFGEDSKNQSKATLISVIDKYFIIENLLKKVEQNYIILTFTYNKSDLYIYISLPNIESIV
jgi:hypothetical protein